MSWDPVNTTHSDADVTIYTVKIEPELSMLHPLGGDDGNADDGNFLTPAHSLVPQEMNVSGSGSGSGGGSQNTTLEVRFGELQGATR